MSKKILYVASTYSHLQNFHMPYINFLKSCGHTVLTMAPEGADICVDFKKFLFSPKNLSTSKRIGQILLQERFDEVYLNTSLAAGVVRLGMLMCKCKPKKVVNIVHGYLWYKGVGVFKPLYILIEKLCAKVTDEVVAMNEFDFIQAKKHKLARSVKFVDGMGVQTKLNKNAVTELHQGLSIGKTLVNVGELSKRKNQIDSIKIVERLVKTDKSYKLLLCGKGKNEKKLKKYAAKRGLQNNVFFLGFRKDVLNVITQCDVLISTSKTEGLPFNVVEALSLNKPCLLSPTKGHTDIARSCKGAVLCASKKEFAKQVQNLPDIRTAGAGVEKYLFDNVFENNLRLIFDAHLNNL